MNDNYRIDTDMNENLQNGYVSSGIGLLNSHNIPQDNKSSKPNDMNSSVYNGVVNGYYCYMNNYTEFLINNHNYSDYTKKIDEFSTDIGVYLRENNGLQYGVDIGGMLSASAPNKNANMEYNNEHHKLLINSNI